MTLQARPVPLPPGEVDESLASRKQPRDIAVLEGTRGGPCNGGKASGIKWPFWPKKPGRPLCPHQARVRSRGRPGAHPEGAGLVTPPGMAWGLPTPSDANGNLSLEPPILPTFGLRLRHPDLKSKVSLLVAAFPGD